MNTKHTPGPWKASSQDAPYQEVYGSGYCVAKMTGGEIGRDKANARLIAAAPDLLEALHAARIALFNRDRNELDEAAYVAVRAAIAKAEGRS